ncbi:hypothetical protein DL770_011538 [Monosporascus sp. CRB-9-2]|nr:hypothetical protein DL770_011538 [Monosporascus sp. CRB-9-2]
MGRPRSRSITPIVSTRSRSSSCVPWLKFSRKTSAPASNRASITSGVIRRDQDRAEVVHVGHRGAGHNCVAQGLEEAVSIVASQRVLRTEAELPGALQCVRCDDGAGDLLQPIDAIGIARNRVNPRLPAQCERE